MSNGIFNFHFLAFVLSEILGGPKFTLGGPALPGGPLAEKNVTYAQVLVYIYIIVNFQLCSLIYALYNRFCIERSAKMGFWRILGEG